MQLSNNLEIYNETNSQVRNRLRILDLKNKILGEKYSLNISVLKPSNAKKINIAQRKKDYIPNTLSFQYTKISGEIILTPSVIKKEMNQYGHTYEKHFFYLLIHSMLHLKGHLHGTKMDSLEEKLLRKYF